jgi:DNA-binding PucR family transcriptional regulator
MQKIRFARMVRLIMQNEHLLAIYTGVMQFLEKMDPHGRPCIFLCAYYLDCCCDIMRTASMLYLHRNTVKYRIHKISTLLGYDISDSNESTNLIVACAVSRLHDAEKMSKKF